MLDDPFQAEVAQIALTAAAPHSFALAGGQALIAHEIVRRPTEDIDLFSDLDDSAAEASEVVRNALVAAGLAAELIPDSSGLDLGNDLVEFEVSRGTQVVRLTLARFDRNLAPVTLDIGTVLHIHDVLGSKMVAMATRAEPRDYIDVAAALQRYAAEELISLGRGSDATLSDEDFAEAMSRLDRLHNSVFVELYGLTDDEVAELRNAFASWPRDVASPR